MKKVVYCLLCILLTAITIDANANNNYYASMKGYKKSGSNVYSGKTFKGHKCPPKRKIINAKYY